MFRVLMEGMYPNVFRELTEGMHPNCSTASKVAEFPSIRVDNPVTLQVNGLALGEGKLVKAELQIQAKSE